MRPRAFSPEEASIIMSNNEPPKLFVVELLTVDEAAALLGTSTRAIYARIRRGTLAGVYRVGRSIRIEKTELLEGMRAAG
jgi:excisionase family DNA binding protein